MRTWAHDVKKGTFRSPWFNNIARSVLCQYGYQNSEEYQTNFDWTDLKRCKINSIQHFWPVMIDIQSLCRARVCWKQAADWLWYRVRGEGGGWGLSFLRRQVYFLTSILSIFSNFFLLFYQSPSKPTPDLTPSWMSRLIRTQWRGLLCPLFCIIGLYACDDGDYKCCEFQHFCSVAVEMNESQRLGSISRTWRLVSS